MSNLKMPKRLFSKSGFTLVELMVVVAIIGILAAVAIPNYQKYQARARQSEAKVMLASAYTALQSYFAEVGTYTQCLRAIGFETTTGAKRYYTVGIDTEIVANKCGPTGDVSCLAFAFSNTGATTSTCANADGETYYAATVGLGGGKTVVGDLDRDGVSQTVFTVHAIGRISSAPALTATAKDSWTIDQAKNLNNVGNGV